MIAVQITINGNPLVMRSAVRVKGNDDEVCDYRCDDDSIIKHKPDDGAVELGKKLLGTISKRWENGK